MPVNVIARVMGSWGTRCGRRSSVSGRRSTRGRGRVSRGCGRAADPELLRAYPAMPATVIAELIGWDRSVRLCGTGSLSCSPRTCLRFRGSAAISRLVRPPRSKSRPGEENRHAICHDRRAGMITNRAITPNRGRRSRVIHGNSPRATIRPGWTAFGIFTGIETLGERLGDRSRRVCVGWSEDWIKGQSLRVALS